MADPGAEERLFDIGAARARLSPGPHPYEVARRDDIDRLWARRQAANPYLFNGATLLSTQWSLTEDTLSFDCRRVDYATLLHWLAMKGDGTGLSGSPVRGGAVHFFASAVVAGSDGHVLMGRMADHTANAGRVYMPAGSLDLDDVTVDGTVDLTGNMHREVREETGLDLGAARPEPGCRVHFNGYLMSVFRVYRFDEPAAALVKRAADFIATGGDGELSAVLSVAPGEVRPEMPRHIQAFMTAFAG